jgi:hypothetical protein
MANVANLREAVRLTIESLPFFNYYYGAIDDINNATETHYLGTLLPVTAKVQLTANEIAINTYSLQIVFAKAIDADNNTAIQAEYLNELEIAVNTFLYRFNQNYPDYQMQNIGWTEEGNWGKFKTQSSVILLKFDVLIAQEIDCYTFEL